MDTPYKPRITRYMDAIITTTTPPALGSIISITNIIILIIYLINSRYDSKRDPFYVTFCYTVRLAYTI